MKKWSTIFEAVSIMFVLQIVRELLERKLQPSVADSFFDVRVVTMVIMIILTVVVIIYSHLRKTALSVFPAKFSRRYVIFTCVSALLLLSTPMLYIDGWRALVLLVYGSIVTPVYEELIFRGYLWNRFNCVVSKELYTFIWSVVLFTFWHLGYIIPHLISGNWSAVFWKLTAGFCYGALLGFVRLKTKNCYSTILLHGVLNNFMI